MLSVLGRPERRAQRSPRRCCATPRRSACACSGSSATSSTARSARSRSRATRSASRSVCSTARVVNVVPEHDDCAAVAAATGRPVKQIWAEALAAATTVRPRSSMPTLAELEADDRDHAERRSSRSRAASIPRWSRPPPRACWGSERSPSRPSRPRSRRASSTARATVAAAVGIAHRAITTDELAREGYRRNGADRCYHCKSELYDRLAALAAAEGFAATFSGANVDDLGDWRPGLRAAAEHDVRHPLVEAGFRKPDVRRVAAELAIPSADKPAMPCLASRLPVRHRGRPRGARADRSRRGGDPGPRLSGPPRSPPRPTSARSSSATTTSRRRDRTGARRRRSSQRCAPPATPTPRSTTSRCAPGSFTGIRRIPLSIA